MQLLSAIVAIIRNLFLALALRKSFCFDFCTDNNNKRNTIWHQQKIALTSTETGFLKNSNLDFSYYIFYTYFIFIFLFVYSQKKANVFVVFFLCFFVFNLIITVHDDDSNFDIRAQNTVHIDTYKQLD